MKRYMVFFGVSALINLLALAWIAYAWPSRLQVAPAIDLVFEDEDGSLFQEKPLKQQDLSSVEAVSKGLVGEGGDRPRSVSSKKEKKGNQTEGPKNGPTQPGRSPDAPKDTVVRNSSPGLAESNSKTQSTDTADTVKNKTASTEKPKEGEPTATAQPKAGKMGESSSSGKGHEEGPSEKTDTGKTSGGTGQGPSGESGPGTGPGNGGTGQGSGGTGSSGSGGGGEGTDFGDESGDSHQGNIQPPVLIKSVTPDYPEEARRKGWQGRVVLELTIDEKGRVKTVKVIQTSGYGILDDAAVKAAWRLRYKPATRDGKPVVSLRKQPFTFNLKED